MIVDDIRINIEGLDEVLAKFEDAPFVLARNLSFAMRKSCIDVVADAKPRTPADTEATRESIDYTVTPTAEGLRGVIMPHTEYAKWLHDGTNPHFPPVTALIPWVRDQLGVSEADAKSVAFLVARKISRVGTKAHPFLTDALKSNRSRIEAFFQSAVQITVEEFNR